MSSVSRLARISRATSASSSPRSAPCQVTIASLPMMRSISGIQICSRCSRVTRAASTASHAAGSSLVSQRSDSIAAIVWERSTARRAGSYPTAGTSAAARSETAGGGDGIERIGLVLVPPRLLVQLGRGVEQPGLVVAATSCGRPRRPGSTRCRRRRRRGAGAPAIAPAARRAGAARRLAGGTRRPSDRVTTRNLLARPGWWRGRRKGKVGVQRGGAGSRGAAGPWSRRRSPARRPRTRAGRRSRGRCPSLGPTPPRPAPWRGPGRSRRRGARRRRRARARSGAVAIARSCTPGRRRGREAIVAATSTPPPAGRLDPGLRGGASMARRLHRGRARGSGVSFRSTAARNGWVSAGVSSTIEKPGAAELVHRHHAVGQGGRLVPVVGDEERGRRGLAEDAPELAGEPIVQLAVEPGERLVEEQGARGGGERAGQGHALRLAAAEVGDVAAAEAAQADQLEHRLDPPLPVRDGHPLHLQPEADVRRDVAVREELFVLEHHPDAAAVGGQASDVSPVQVDRARRGHDEAGDDAQERRLAAAGGAEQGDDLGVADGQRSVAEDGRAVERDRDVTNFEHGRVRGSAEGGRRGRGGARSRSSRRRGSSPARRPGPAARRRCGRADARSRSASSPSRCG